LRKERIAQGGIAATTIDIKLLMKKALDIYASAIIVAHNHPSGNLSPSQSDIQLTKRIKEAVSFFDINLLDHLIISQNKYYSFMEEDLL
jgi:DNA repair protein RadC